MPLDTFVFSKEEGQNIIVADTFLPVTSSAPPNDNVHHTFFELKKLKEKDLKLHMHIVSLSDYWREGIIPRGLRINKFPSFSTSDNDFKSKWEAILNKCSQDLILLLIQQAKAEKVKNGELITAFEASLQQTDTNISTPFIQRISAGLKQLEEQIKTIKIRKMRRDQTDYMQQCVYQWHRYPGGTQRHSRPRPEASSSSDMEPSTSQQDTLSSTSTQSTSSFLEDEWPVVGAKPKGRKKQEEVRRGRTHDHGLRSRFRSHPSPRGPNLGQRHRT